MSIYHCVQVIFQWNDRLLFIIFERTSYIPCLVIAQTLLDLGDHWLVSQEGLKVIVQIGSFRSLNQVVH